MADQASEGGEVGPGAVVKVYLLEGSFPFTAPPSVLSSAGSLWNSFALAHAGLGFMVEESNQKFVIEYYAEDYVGSFLPNLVRRNESAVATGNGTALGVDVTWRNQAALRFSTGFNETLWTSASFVAKITGLLYNDVKAWSEIYLSEHPAYKPISVCNASSMGIPGLPPLEPNPAAADLALDPSNSSSSYDFVWGAFTHLAHNGLNLADEVVLPPMRTGLCIFAGGGGVAAEVLPLYGNEEEVEDYYVRTSTCVSNLLAAAASYPGHGSSSDELAATCPSGDGEGALSVLQGLEGCLKEEPYALLYHNSSSYLRVPLVAEKAGIHKEEAPDIEGGVGGAGAGAGAPTTRAWGHTDLQEAARDRLPPEDGKGGMPTNQGRGIASSDSALRGKGTVLQQGSPAGSGEASPSSIHPRLQPFPLPAIMVAGGNRTGLIRYTGLMPPRPVQPPHPPDSTASAVIGTLIAIFLVGGAGLAYAKVRRGGGQGGSERWRAGAGAGARHFHGWRGGEGQGWGGSRGTLGGVRVGEDEGEHRAGLMPSEVTLTRHGQRGGKRGSGRIHNNDSDELGRPLLEGEGQGGRDLISEGSHNSFRGGYKHTGDEQVGYENIGYPHTESSGYGSPLSRGRGHDWESFRGPGGHQGPDFHTLEGAETTGRVGRGSAREGSGAVGKADSSNPILDPNPNPDPFGSPGEEARVRADRSSHNPLGCAMRRSMDSDADEVFC